MSSCSHSNREFIRQVNLFHPFGFPILTRGFPSSAIQLCFKFKAYSQISVLRAMKMSRNRLSDNPSQ